MKITLRLFLLVFLVGQAALNTVAAENKPIAIVHARLIDGMGGIPIENAIVIVRGKSIEYAGPATGATVPKDAQVIDAIGKSVMPGLADLHVH